MLHIVGCAMKGQACDRRRQLLCMWRGIVHISVGVQASNWGREVCAMQMGLPNNGEKRS